MQLWLGNGSTLCWCKQISGNLLRWRWNGQVEVHAWLIPSMNPSRKCTALRIITNQLLVFSIAMPFSLEKPWRFVETYHFLLHLERVSQTRYQKLWSRKAEFYLKPWRWRWYVLWKHRALSVLVRSVAHRHCCEDLRSGILNFFFLVDSLSEPELWVMRSGHYLRLQHHPPGVSVLHWRDVTVFVSVSHV